MGGEEGRPGHPVIEAACRLLKRWCTDEPLNSAVSCPRCSGTDLWDDNLWWGCNHCGFACHGTNEPTFFFAKDLPGLARSVEEMKERGQWPLLDY
jgi:hypothetical protein